MASPGPTTQQTAYEKLVKLSEQPAHRPLYEQGKGMQQLTWQVLTGTGAESQLGADRGHRWPRHPRSVSLISPKSRPNLASFVTVTKP